LASPVSAVQVRYDLPGGYLVIHIPLYVQTSSLSTEMCRRQKMALQAAAVLRGFQMGLGFPARGYSAFTASPEAIPLEKAVAAPAATPHCSAPCRVPCSP